jgi:hypothetical protein
MSGAAITRQLLVARAELIALVPSTRIFAGVVPQGTALPCIGITEVASTDRKTLKGVASIKVNDVVQITVMAPNYPSCKSAMAQARKACRDYVGDIGRYIAITSHLESKGPDFQSESGFVAQTQDVRITFNESAN